MIESADGRPACGAAAPARRPAAPIGRVAVGIAFVTCLAVGVAAGIDGDAVVAVVATLVALACLDALRATRPS